MHKAELRLAYSTNSLPTPDRRSILSMRLSNSLNSDTPSPESPKESLGGLLTRLLRLAPELEPLLRRILTGMLANVERRANEPHL